jgi:hypothetical protein
VPAQLVDLFQNVVFQDVIVSTFAGGNALCNFKKKRAFRSRDGSHTPENHVLGKLAGTTVLKGIYVLRPWAEAQRIGGWLVGGLLAKGPERHVSLACSALASLRNGHFVATSPLKNGIFGNIGSTGGGEGGMAGWGRVGESGAGQGWPRAGETLRGRFQRGARPHNSAPKHFRKQHLFLPTIAEMTVCGLCPARYFLISVPSVAIPGMSAEALEAV